MSRYEISRRTGLSWQQSQRALGVLQEKGLIGRRQNAKAAGETAITLVSAGAYALFGLQGGAKIGSNGLPNEFGPLLAGESESLIQLVSDAWAAGVQIETGVGANFRGGSRRWAQIEFLLAGRMEQLQQETMAAIAQAEATEAEEAAGQYGLDLPSGERLIFDQKAFQHATSGLDTAIRGSDIRFARDVLEILCTRAPERVNSKSAPRLAAEILFSRQKGFVWRHDYSAACRVVASVIGRGTWKKPNRIDETWYRSALASVRCGRPQGVQTCVA